MKIKQKRNIHLKIETKTPQQSTLRINTTQLTKQSEAGSEATTEAVQAQLAGLRVQH